jgi:hypothetical protein
MKDDPWPMVSPAKFTREIRKDQVRIGNRCHLQRFPMKIMKKCKQKQLMAPRTAWPAWHMYLLLLGFQLPMEPFSTRFNMFQRPWGTAP